MSNRLFFPLRNSIFRRSTSLLRCRVSKPLPPLELSPKLAWICPCSPPQSISALGLVLRRRTTRVQARRKPLGSHGQATTSSHCLFNVRFVRFAQNRILKFAIGIYLLKSAGVTRKPLLLLPECCLPSFTTSSKRTNPIIPSFMLTLTTLRRIIGRFPWRRLSLFSSVRASVFPLLLFNLLLYPSIFRLLRGSLFCHALLAIPLFRNVSNFLLFFIDPSDGVCPTPLKTPERSALPSDVTRAADTAL